MGGNRLPISGAYCLASEKADQALDLVKEAADNLSLQLNRDLSIFVDVGAEKIFDEVYCIHVLELLLFHGSRRGQPSG